MYIIIIIIMGARSA